MANKKEKQKEKEKERREQEERFVFCPMVDATDRERESSQ
jgi:hypothetical protein